MNNGEKTKLQVYFHYSVLVILLLFSVTLQSASVGGLALFGFSTLPAVAYVIGIGMNYGAAIGGVLGLFTGLLLDIYTVPSVGFHLFMMPLLGIGCGLAVNHLLMHNFYARIVLCLCGSFLYCTGYFVVLKWIIGGHDFSYFYRFSLPTVGVCTLMSVIYAVVLRWFHGRL